MKNLLCNIGQNIVKHKVKTLLSVIISISLCLFLMLFTGNLSGTQKRLEALPEEIEITIDITNIAGSKKSGLTIPIKYINHILESGLTNTKQLTGRAVYTGLDTEIPPGNMPLSENLVAGIATEYSLNQYENQKLTYMEGYSADMFSTDEKVALVLEDYLSENNLSLGDTVEINMYTLQGRGANSDGSVYTSYKMGTYSFKIVGTFSEYGEDGEAKLFLANKDQRFDFVIPFATMAQLIADSNRIFYPSSASFTPKDPYNLNAVKEMLKESGLLQLSNMNTNTDGFYGQTAVMSDSIFISTAEPLQRRLSLLQSIYPVCMAAIALISFFASYLLTQSRLSEMAIFRSLGVSRLGVFFMMWFEGLILSGIGALIAFVLSAAVFPENITAMLMAAAIYFAAYLIGSAAAIIISNRVQVLEILTSTKQ